MIGKQKFSGMLLVCSKYRFFVQRRASLRIVASSLKRYTNSVKLLKVLSYADRTQVQHDTTRRGLHALLSSPMRSQIRRSRIPWDIHVHPHTESMRFVNQSNRPMLSQNVTCCIFGATCDRFVIPIMYVK